MTVSNVCMIGQQTKSLLQEKVSRDMEAAGVSLQPTGHWMHQLPAQTSSTGVPMTAEEVEKVEAHYIKDDRHSKSVVLRCSHYCIYMTLHVYLYIMQNDIISCSFQLKAQLTKVTSEKCDSQSDSKRLAARDKSNKNG